MRLRNKEIIGVLRASLIVATGLQPVMSYAINSVEVQNFWKSPGRYQLRAHPQMSSLGLFQVRLTIEGSKWLYDYEKKRRIVKTPPGAISPPLTSIEQIWETWINGKIAFDRANSALEARKRNVLEMGSNLPALVIPTDPGMPPSDLVAKFGEPPVFSEVVRPAQHVVKLDGKEFVALDNPVMRARYSYYRFSNGIMSMGEKVSTIPIATQDALMKDAKISQSQRKVLNAVSLLEGGFDSINTYDTGYVSAGLIQFACLPKGSGSLGQVLLCQKNADPKSFNKDFQKLGIDVKADGQLIAINIDSGQLNQGPAAAAEIINDPRLASAFQRAGRISKPNRIAQLKIAMEMYYPGNDVILVFVNGTAIKGKVSDVFKSEAGLATLMDMKVNTGELGKLSGFVTTIMNREKFVAVADCSRFEKELVRLLAYRKNYLLDKSLTQPQEIPASVTPSEPNFTNP